MINIFDYYNYVGPIGLLVLIVWAFTIEFISKFAQSCTLF